MSMLIRLVSWRPGWILMPWFPNALLTGLMTMVLGGAANAAQPKPVDADPADHSFPALGMRPERKVAVAWNQYYDSKGLGAILARLHKAFPSLTRLYSIGRSVEGRELWCLEVTSPKGDASRKPGMYIDGNIHGNEIQGGEVVAYTAWYLCHQYGNLPKITDLMDHCVFYLIPTINPDGRDRWLHHPQNTHTSRSGVKPRDDDRDGLADEDDVDDLDGDGSIVQMRIRDPLGRFKPHPRFPEIMVAVESDEAGEYTLLGSEGLDNDGDGLVNEDPVGGYDMNRNWAWDWQPDYIQRGAHAYPFSLPETRAIADFVLAHPNIAAVQSYHNFGGMLLRGPGRAGGNIQEDDDRILQFIARRGEQMLPFYRSMIIYRDLYTVWGGEVDWFYSGLGILSFTSEIWNLRSLNKAAEVPSNEVESAFLRHVLMEDGLVAWKPFDHPTYGRIEIGGYKKPWSRTPPSFFLEEECHRNMAFTLYHAAQMPQLRIAEVSMEKLEPELYKVWVTLENTRIIPTRTAQDLQNHISPPDIVSLSGPRIRVISSGRVTQPYFKRVEPAPRHERPERFELNRVGGRSAERVQFIVSGQGRFKVEVDSAKAGRISVEQELPL